MKTKLLLASLLLFSIASAQAPKVKNKYCGYKKFNAKGEEIMSYPHSHVQFSPSGKVLFAKAYANGKTVAQWVYEYNNKDSLINETRSGEGANKVTTSIVYSEKSDTVKKYHFENSVCTERWEYSYFKNGNKSFERTYNSENNLILEIKYDISGKAISVIDKDSISEYDTFGNKIEETSDMFITYTKYTNDGKYWTEWESISVLTDKSRKRTFVRNASGKVIKETNYWKASIEKVNGVDKIVFADSNFTINDYDEKNNLISTTNYDKDKKIKYKYTHQYDNNNNEIKELNFDGNGECTRMTIWTYDKYGNMLEEVCYTSDKSNIVFYKFYYEYEFY